MAPTRRVVITQYGDVDVLKVVQADCPAPPTGHLQIATLYSGFNGADVNMRKGLYPMMKKAPLTPGYCLVGRVQDLGPNCTKGFQKGDLVAVLTKYDAEADLVNQPEKYCLPVPDGVDPQQATALVLDWATAYGMVVQVAQVQRGQRVFVHGVSGAVGFALMKLAQLQGAQVFGTASPRNHERIRAEGATPFSYAEKKWMEEMKMLGGAHAVFDPLGFDSFDESYAVLAEKGILVGYGTNKASLGDGGLGNPYVSVLKLFAKGLNPMSGKRTTFFGLSRDAATFLPNLEKLLQLAKEGKITVPIKHVWDLEDIKAAHREWGSGSGVGSYLIKVSTD